MRQESTGFVLMVVLWVLAILTVITISFAYRATLDVQSAAYALDHRQAMMMARGAVHRGMLELQNKAVFDYLEIQSRETDPQTLQTLEPENPVTHLGQQWAQSVNLTDTGSLQALGGSSEDGAWYTIEDEERYIDINRALPALLRSIKALRAPVRRRISIRLTAGAQSGEPPLAFHSIEELRYDKEVTAEDWYGTERAPGLKNLISTVGGGLVNVNTANTEVLDCIPSFNGSAVRAIQEYRRDDDPKADTASYRGFRKLSDVAKVTGISEATLKRYCKLNSNYFKIYGVATRRSGKIRAVCSALLYTASGSTEILAWREESLGS